MKKILAFALISAAFFFGCSADAGFNSGIEPPAWDNAPPSLNPSNPNDIPGGGGGGGGSSWCVDHEYEACTDNPIATANAQACDFYFDGVLAASCPAGYDRY